MEGRYERRILVLVLALMLMMLGADAQDKKKKGPKVLKAKKLVPYIKCDACKAFGICINIGCVCVCERARNIVDMCKIMYAHARTHCTSVRNSERNFPRYQFIYQCAHICTTITSQLPTCSSRSGCASRSTTERIGTRVRSGRK